MSLRMEPRKWDRCHQPWRFRQDEVMKSLYSGSQFPQYLCYGSPKASRNSQKSAVPPCCCPCPSSPETSFPIVTLLPLVLQLLLQEVATTGLEPHFTCSPGKGSEGLFPACLIFLRGLVFHPWFKLKAKLLFTLHLLISS